MNGASAHAGEVAPKSICFGIGIRDDTVRVSGNDRSPGSPRGMVEKRRSPRHVITYNSMLPLQGRRKISKLFVMLFLGCRPQRFLNIFGVLETF